MLTIVPQEAPANAVFPSPELYKLALVAVPTYRRPKMLEACLASLLGQDIPENTIMHIVVIDNDPLGSGFNPYVKATQDSGVMTSYLMEKTRGLAAVRNRALDFAQEKQADYLCFIDDDETAQGDWLSCLVRLFPEEGMVQGKRTMLWDLVPESDRPKKKISKHELGDYLDRAATHNLRISSALIQSGLRFDPAFSLSGGEDDDYTMRAVRNGYKIRYNPLAITWEFAQPEKSTLEYRLRFAHSAAVNKLRIKAKFKPVSKFQYSLSSLLVQASGYARQALSWLMWPIDRQRAGKIMERGKLKVAIGKGRWDGVRGAVPKLYLVTTGE